MGEMGEEGPKAQTSSYQISKSWGCNVQHGDYSQQDCILYLIVAKRGDLKSSPHKRKFVTMCGDRC